MKAIKTEITIQSTTEKVWNVLMDFENYPNWNPFITSVIGTSKKGEQLVNTLQLEGQKPQTFKPTILEVEKEKSFRWKGHLFIKGLFDGEHYFLLEKLDDAHVKLTHGEHFSGIMSGAIMKMIGEKTERGFVAMNNALKTKAEQ
jgi:hypothetical protein